MMIRLKNAILNVRPILWIFLGLSLAWLILYEAILINIPEIFPNASLLGSLFRIITAGYISSFIFYFLVVHLKEESIRDIEYPVILHFCNVIINSFKEMMANIIKDDSNYFSLSKDQFLSTIKQIEATPTATRLLVNSAGLPFSLMPLPAMKRFKTISENRITSIVVKFASIDTSIRDEVLKIENSKLFNLLDAIYENGVMPGLKVDNLSIFALPLYEMMQLIISLNALTEKHEQKYPGK